MSKDLPDFLGGELVSEAAPSADAPIAAAPEAPETTPAEAAPAAEATAAPEGPPRGPDGKFAAVDTPAPAEPPPVVAPAAPAQAEAAPPHHVPLTTFLDVRDRLSAAEKRASELAQWRAEQEAQARRQPVPSRDEDPEAYEAYREAQTQAALYSQRIEMSRGFAEMRHGPEATETAFKWGVARCDQDPFFNEKVRASRDPVGLVVEEWKREQILHAITPDKFKAFQEWQASQSAEPAPVAAAAPPAPTAAPAAPPQPPAAPRPSLAAAPSAAATAAAIPRDGEAAFDAMFGR